MWGTNYPKIELQHYTGGAWTTEVVYGTYTFARTDTAYLSAPRNVAVKECPDFVLENDEISSIIRGWRYEWTLEFWGRSVNETLMTFLFSHMLDWLLDKEHVGDPKRILFTPHTDCTETYVVKIKDDEIPGDYENKQWIRGFRGSIILQTVDINDRPIDDTPPT